MVVTTSNNPEIDKQRSCGQVDRNDVGFVQLKVFIRLRRLDRVASRSISKHAVASHLDVEHVLLAVSPALGKDPLDAVTTTRETL